MIQQLMVYGIGLAAMLGVAALGLEHLSALRRQPRRIAWVLALLLSVLLPPLMIQRVAPASAAGAVVAPTPVVGQHEASVPELPAPHHAISEPAIAQSEALQPSTIIPLQPVPPPRQWHLPQFSDRALLQAWAVASLLAGLYLIGAQLRLRRRIAGWQSGTLQDREVLISDCMGPALVGVFRPRMVIPRWLLDESPATQRLIVEHEQQHVAAKDPLLIRMAVVLLAVLPWNLPMWWQWRRMRQAIELDCDARVLRAGTDPYAYGEVLLSIAGRATRMPSTVVAMSEPVSALERRIQNLLPDPVRHVVWRTVGAISVLVIGIGAAIAMDAPVISAHAPLQMEPAPIVAAAQSAPPAPMAIEARPAATAPLATMLAAAAEAPAIRPEMAAAATAPNATPDATGMSPREMAQRAATQRYPELVNGPEREDPWIVTLVLRADGTVHRSSLASLNIIPFWTAGHSDGATDIAAATSGSGAMAGVVNEVLDRRAKRVQLQLGGRPWAAVIEPQVGDGVPGERILKGQQIANVGKSSRDFELFWQVLPADLDESRDAGRVVDAVRAKHQDLLFPSESPQPGIQLLTVLMDERGQIAGEAVELLSDAQYKSLDPQPVVGDPIRGAIGEPCNFYNPPPVPTEAFKVLGLDAARIGKTGFLRVTPVEWRPSAHAVLVRYAWPRRPGESIGGR